MFREKDKETERTHLVFREKDKETERTHLVFREKEKETERTRKALTMELFPCRLPVILLRMCVR